MDCEAQLSWQHSYIPVAQALSKITNKPRKLGKPDLVTALHGMQTRSSYENSVRLSVRRSVCPSVRHTREL